jgi:hypothetical protein
MVITPHGEEEVPDRARKAFDTVLKARRLRAQWDYRYIWGNCLHDSVAELMPARGFNAPGGILVNGAWVRDQAAALLRNSDGGQRLSPGAQAALLRMRERPGPGQDLPTLAELVNSAQERLEAGCDAPDRAGWADPSSIIAVCAALRIRVVAHSALGGIGVSSGFWAGTEDWPQYDLAFSVIDQTGAGHYTPCRRRPGWRAYVPGENEVSGYVDLTLEAESSSEQSGSSEECEFDW